MPEDSVPPLVVLAPAELDLASAPAFERDLERAFGSGAGPVVADLGCTSFCDSSGLKVLVHAAMRARACGRRFVVRRPSPMVRRMVEILGASALLNLSAE